MPIRPAAPGRQYKPAPLRFHFDADVLGLAHQIAGLRPDATYAGDPGGVVMRQLRPPCPITSPSTKDRDWIPQVTALSWLIITRDARGTFDQLEVFMSRWRAIEACLDEPGPFIYVATRTTFRTVDLIG